jgi:hypothetical protein
VKQGKEKPEPNERVKMAMDHGSKNEINEIKRNQRKQNEINENKTK